MTLTDIEKEVILLKDVWELIASMVNFEMLKVYGNDSDSNILFNTMTHLRFLNSVLVDFLSRTDKRAFFKQTSYLGALKNISKNPNFDMNGSVNSLRTSTHEFSEWPEQEIEVH